MHSVRVLASWCDIGYVGNLDCKNSMANNFNFTSLKALITLKATILLCASKTAAKFISVQIARTAFI